MLWPPKEDHLIDNSEGLLSLARWVFWWLLLGGEGFGGGRERGVKVKRELEKRFVSGSIQTLLGLVFHVMWNGEVAVSTGWKGRSLGKELRDRNLASWRKKKKKG